MTKTCHRRRKKKLGLALLISVISVAGFACSIPSLESQQCSEARVALKQFYSFHFGNDMSPTKENLSERKPYLTDRLFKSLWAADSIPGDHFTATSNYPKAFRVGECTAASPEKTVFQVILLWHDDTRSEQKEIAVDMVRQGDKWLVDSVLTVPKK
jgi:hypothetical protein